MGMSQRDMRTMIGMNQEIRALREALAERDAKLAELQQSVDFETYLIEFRHPAESARAGRDVWHTVVMQRPIRTAENACAVAVMLTSATKISHRAVKVVAVQVIETALISDQTER